MAAECAGAQDESLFWQMKDYLYHFQHFWASVPDPTPALHNLGSKLAFDAANRPRAGDQLALDMRAFWACYQGSTQRHRLSESAAMAAAAGVEGTPTFIVNGERVLGYRDAEAFAEILDRALAGSGR